MMTKTETPRATAKDINLCVRAHLTDGDQDAANNVANDYAFGPKDARGWRTRHFDSRSARKRISLLSGLGVTRNSEGDWALV